MGRRLARRCGGPCPRRPYCAVAVGATERRSGFRRRRGSVCEPHSGTSALLSLLDRMEQIPRARRRAAPSFSSHSSAPSPNTLWPKKTWRIRFFTRMRAAEAAEKLYREHADMKIHLFALQQENACSRPSRRNCRHAREEEDEVFPRLRELRQARNHPLEQKSAAGRSFDCVVVAVFKRALRGTPVAGDSSGCETKPRAGDATSINADFEN